MTALPLPWGRGTEVLDTAMPMLTADIHLVLHLLKPPLLPTVDPQSQSHYHFYI